MVQPSPGSSNLKFPFKAGGTKVGVAEGKGGREIAGGKGVGGADRGRERSGRGLYSGSQLGRGILGNLRD